MADLAQAIESTFADVRVMWSDLSTGIIEIFEVEKDYSDTVGRSISEKEYNFFANNLKGNIESVKVKGVAGFDNVVVEEVAVSSTINEVRVSLNRGVKDGLIVAFESEQVMLNGIPERQIKKFLALKTDLEVDQIENRGYGDYFVPVPDMTPKELNNQMLTQETIEIESLIESESKDGDELVIKFRHAAFVDREIDIDMLSEFIVLQRELKQNSSVNVTFNRPRLEMTIAPNENFGPEFVLADIKSDDHDRAKIQDEIKQAEHEIRGNTLIIKSISVDTDASPLRALFERYENQVQLDFDFAGDDHVDLRIKVVPETVEQRRNSFFSTTSGRCVTPAVFIIESRERHAHRFRIFASGYGLAQLSNLPFVDTNITFSSHPREMAEFFGIEVARSYIYSELVANSGGAGGRHNGLFADVLTYTGNVIAINKKGKEAMKQGVYSRAALQETFDVFMKATASAEVENLRSGVSKTAIGDFGRDEYKAAKLNELVPESAVKSTMELLMRSTAELGSGRKTRRRPRRRRVNKRQIQAKMIDILDEKFDPVEGTL